ncbi:uncharacterized protein [Zea mays]|uniref:uncharacterized protein isoform X2 n=1 Tax=Zea mays TaxID=4577 RepID=UPI0004DECB9F|nr:uncharacterized protein LOC103632594 isoform X2 [Zea mays]|eukprot:XP_008652573.1 uncharacterized protein LOC103632594 isoform X2 [Zea mays]
MGCASSKANADVAVADVYCPPPTSLNLKTSVPTTKPPNLRPRPQRQSVPTTKPPNLRPRPQRQNAQPQDEQAIADLQTVGDFLTDNVEVSEDDPINATKKRPARGITKMEGIFSRSPEMPKIKILLNDRGQPIGKSARQLSSAIGCQVRKKLSIATTDWRLVDINKKYELWEDIKTYYDVDAAALNWVMRTAGKKWKQFKASIKQRYFNPELSIKEIPECPDKRVNDDDWHSMYNYWMSSEFQDRSEKAKINRQKLKMHHTAGSVSYACSEYDLAVKLGRPPRRDENFIQTHTRKNGVPTEQAKPIIDQLNDVLGVYPELKDRSIQEGDAFSIVCGPKEPKGYVRVLGLGPTPQDIGTPELKSYTATRLQMEILARTKVQSEKAALEERVLELQTQIEQRAQPDRASEEPMSHRGSTSFQHKVMRNKFAAEDEEDNEEYCASEDEELDDEDDQIFHQMQGANSPRSTRHFAEASHSKHDDLVGKDVILYAMLRSDLPVAKGTIVSTKPSTTVGGQILGRQYCEVIVTCVIKRDTVLPRPCANVETMADAYMMSVAWPYKKLKLVHKAATPSSGGCSGQRKLVP